MTGRSIPCSNHRRGARRAGGGAAGRRAREHDHQPRHALPAERRRWPATSRASSATTARSRRPSPCSTGGRRIGLAADDLELLATSDEVDQGHHPRPAVRRLARPARRHHGRLDDAARGARRHPRLRHRRPRRRAPRGASSVRRVSADLTELSTTSVTVVSAGVKSILDIGLTLETLETLGVPVLGYGTDEFPSFYSRTSGHRRPDARRDRRRGRGADAGQVGPRPVRRHRRRQPDPRRVTRSPPSRSAPSSTRPSPTWTPAGSTARTPRRTCSAGSSRSPAAEPDGQHRAGAQQRAARRRGRAGVRLSRWFD